MKRSDIIRRLRKDGWTVATRRARSLRLPREVAARYAKLPASFTEFIGGLSSCVNKTQTAWFLCEADYAGTSGTAFRWDEWERISLEAAGDDSRFVTAARTFWDVHFPFLLSVGNGYEYFAIQTSAKRFGRVVHGCEPDFEAASQVAKSFEEFLLLLTNGSIRA